MDKVVILERALVTSLTDNWERATFTSTQIIVLDSHEVSVMENDGWPQKKITLYNMVRNEYNNGILTIHT